MERNCTIICTIHQPSSKLFHTLDRVIFLAGGKVTYQGLTASLMAEIITRYDEAGYGTPPIGNEPEIWLDFTDRLSKESTLDAICSSKYESADTCDAAVLEATPRAAYSYANNFFMEVNGSPLGKSPPLHA